MNSFEEKVTAAVREHNMFGRGASVIAALSGGADSVSLLRVLTGLKDSLGIKVEACHLNHGLRGAESDADEEFCRSLCERLGVHLSVRRVNVEELRGRGESTELCARRARYDFFREVLESGEFFEERVLATAHTASDNAETVLFNMVRGAGLEGLCGIPPKRPLGSFSVVRPLIYCTRAEVERYLSSLSQDFVTDKSNLSDEYSRNKIRLNVIPELLKINPSAVETVYRMTKNLRADSEYLGELAKKALESAREGRGWNAAELSKLPEPVKLRAVKMILAQGKIEPSDARIRTAAKLLEKRSARYNPCKDRFFTIRRGVCFTEQIKQNFHGYNEGNFQNL